jgi:uncharacterized protein
MSGNAYHEIAFTPAVLALQDQGGSRQAYARVGARQGGNDVLGPAEMAFIAERDGFYVATVSETGWPYVQFRGGPAGFARTPNPSTIAWADFRGNQQFISSGNVVNEHRVALFFMDYGGQRRLKVFGRLVFLPASEHSELAAQLAIEGYRAKVDRVALVTVEAWDRNCPQHIPQRYTLQELGLPADHPVPPVPRASSR